MVALEPINPPLAQAYDKVRHPKTTTSTKISHEILHETLPLIDLSGLLTSTDEDKRAKCASDIVQASSKWGFFQVVNHGVNPQLLTRMRREQTKLFNTSFSTKSTFGLLNNSYRWGTSSATSPNDFSWSEAFHIPLAMVSDQACYGEFLSLREVMVEYVAAMQKLSKLLAGVLIKNLGQETEALEEMIGSTCFLRLNKYPPCPLSPGVHGMVPHTDSDFLTIVHQDQVGGLQLMKDSKWVAVKPNKDALIVNIGDLFQAWSNDLYKSVEHRVMGNPKVERFSVAYFLTPSPEFLIRSCRQPSVYRDFTFGEYRNKVQQDAKLLGRKIGLSRFLL